MDFNTWLFSSDAMLYAATAIAFLVSVIIVKKRRTEIEKFETSDLDRINSGIARINTEALQRPLRQIIEAFEQSRYTQNLFGMPQSSMEAMFYRQVCTTIATDLEQGVRRQLTNCEIGVMRIRQASDSQMYAVMELHVVAPVNIQYTLYHSTIIDERTENEKRRYLFRMERDGWKLYGIETVED